MRGGVVGLAIFLVCFSARGEVRDQTLASCHLDALRTYSSEEGPYSRKLDQYDLVCMEAKGYRFTVDPTDCGRLKGDLYEDPGCYVRSN